MYYREPQQILVLDHLAYQQQHDKKQETDIFTKTLVYQWKASIHKGKELRLQM
jgi:hypothetical protein